MKTNKKEVVSAFIFYLSTGRVIFSDNFEEICIRTKLIENIKDINTKVMLDDGKIISIFDLLNYINIEFTKADQQKFTIRIFDNARVIKKLLIMIEKDGNPKAEIYLGFIKEI
jgi:hypothetical protein